VIAPDFLGCGASDRPPPDRCEGYSLRWLAGTIDALLRSSALELVAAGGAPRPVHVLGHSLGGAVATLLVAGRGSLAARDGLTLATLTLVDSSCFTMPMPLEGRLALLPHVGPLVFHRLYRRGDLRRYFTRVYSSPQLVDEGAVSVYWDQLTRQGGREAAYAMLQELSELDAMSARFCEIAVPTLVVWGELDALIPLAMGRRLADLIPGARFEVIAGCGHAPNEERPAELAELLRQHVSASLDRVS
jgi:pimeloyl-ACP methyl ester carboxylesterase